jgi:hypothetical protein
LSSFALIAQRRPTITLKERMTRDQHAFTVIDASARSFSSLKYLAAAQKDKDLPILATVFCDAPDDVIPFCVLHITILRGRHIDAFKILT